MAKPSITNITLKSELEHSNVMEQYKLMVGTLDKNHANRDGTNSFYTSINSFLISIASAINSINFDFKHKEWLFMLLTLIGMVSAFSWHSILRRLKKLDALYSSILIDLESHLKAPVYRTVIYGGEKYEAPPGFITNQEMAVPLLFIAIYACNFLIFGGIF